MILHGRKFKFLAKSFINSSDLKKDQIGVITDFYIDGLY